MKKVTLIIFSLFVFNFTFGQNSEKYTELIKEAWSLYKSKEYLQSAQKYNEAFIVLGNKGYLNDRYNAACSWALANEADSAFVQLFNIAEKQNYNNIEHITNDSDLNSLHRDSRWAELIKIVKKNKENIEGTGANHDKSLIAMLDTIFQDDQNYRLKMDSIRKKYGWDSEEYKEIWKIIHQKDSVNIIKIRKILDERGWLGVDIIGNQGNKTLFLVIQHSGKEIREQYLPMMREAVKNGNANAIDLAYLEDRTALDKGEKQIYGSQIMHYFEPNEYVIRPLIDPDNVDKRRAEIGLGTMQDLLFYNYGLNWDVEEYKKNLPKYEERERGKQ